MQTVDYAAIADMLDSLTADTACPLSALANTSALLWQELPALNWCGFYLKEPNGDSLLLGPFQGKPACLRIAYGKGVCGTTAAENRTVRVEDVHAFPGHIACDSASASEIVIPMYENGVLWGVLDIDSPVHGRFTKEDEAGLERLAAVMMKNIPMHLGLLGV